MPRRFVLTSVLAPLLVLALTLAGARWVDGRVEADGRSRLNAALDTIPVGTTSAGFTDWAQVRGALGLGSVRTDAERARLADESSLRDLSTRSAIGQYAVEMHRAYGWSAADVEWEAYGQGRAGSALVARLDGSVSFGTLRARLAALGYTEDASGERPLWSLPTDSGPAGPDLATALRGVVLLPGSRLVVASDTPAYARRVARTAEHDEPSLLSVRAAADVATALVGVDSALVQSGPSACLATTLDGQGGDVLAQARAAIGRAGELSTPIYAGRGIDAGSASMQVMRFALGFGSPGLAARQLEVRSALASGPFIGRTGQVEDSLVLRSSTVRGSTAVLRFGHDPDSLAYMTGDGPLLFAGCPVTER